MNSGILPVGSSIHSPAQPDWQAQLGAWRELLAKCVHKPTRKRVHGLRVLTLRLQAQAEHWVHENVAGEPFVEQAQRWSKQADRLRKALSPGRDADVYLQMLKTLRGPALRDAGENCQSSRDYARELERLERRLKRKRETAEKKLQTAIEKRATRLERRSREFEAGLTASPMGAVVDCLRAVHQIVTELAAAAPTLNAESLHAFRKRAKTARYLAEVSAGHDTVARRQAVLLKKMQNAAGVWHDWQTLAEMAVRLLGAHEKSGLARLLQTLANRSLENALGECRRTMAQLVELGVRDGEKREAVQKKMQVRAAALARATDHVYYA